MDNDENSDENLGQKIRRTRKFVSIKCPKCDYPRGTQDENGQIICQMCGEIITGKEKGLTDFMPR